jgi:hypothetical protein
VQRVQRSGLAPGRGQFPRTSVLSARCVAGSQEVDRLSTTRRHFVRASGGAVKLLGR